MTQFIVSIAGVFAVAALVWYLGLGDAKLKDADQARRLAEDMVSGFEASQVMLSSDQQAALISGADDNFVLLKRHGAKFAARALTAPLHIAQEGEKLIVDSGEMTFGAVQLNLSKDDADRLLTMM